MSGQDRSEPGRPLLRVVQGAPSEAELAALVAVLAAVGSSAEEAPPAGTSPWAAPERLLRQPLAPTGWWASGLPR